jgi:C-terminal processing protease CtpA/Prc
MRKLPGVLLLLALAGCGDSSGSAGPQVGTAACQNDGQKQFVLDGLYAWYLWNNLLPADIDIADYTTPEELVRVVTTTFGPKDADGNPTDRFSSVGSAQADAEFFGEGRFEGFGFSYRTVDAAADDIRLSRVFSDSPAANGGLARGQQFVSLDGRSISEIQANEGIGAVFSNNTTLQFEMRRTDGSVFSSSITKGVVTISPVPQRRVIDAGNGVMIGYMELAQFIGTAGPIINDVFAEFIAAGVDDIIIDLRYNGGGLVSTANLLGDYLGAFANDGRVFSETRFNADRAAANDSTEFFQRQGNSIDLGRLVVIASRGTASASELVTNSLEAYFDVTIVGDSTFGKPVGQIGLTFCDKILRPTSFKTVNAAGEGDYFDGLPVDCPAADDLNFEVGDDSDPNMIAAMTYLNTGACPAAAAGGQFKPGGEIGIERRDRRGPAHREFADAY